MHVAYVRAVRTRVGALGPASALESQEEVGLLANRRGASQQGERGATFQHWFSLFAARASLHRRCTRALSATIGIKWGRGASERTQAAAWSRKTSHQPAWKSNSRARQSGLVWFSHYARTWAAASSDPAASMPCRATNKAQSGPNSQDWNFGGLCKKRRRSRPNRPRSSKRAMAARTGQEQGQGGWGGCASGPARTG